MKPKLLQLLLILAPGLCMWLAWPPAYLVVLLFVAFVPLLIIANQKTKGYVFYLQIYFSILIWNIANTLWVYNASSMAIIMLTVNSFLMTIPFVVYRNAIKKYSAQKALLIFILFWLSFEFIHHRWDISWPWLTLGNGLAQWPELMQWYSFTGRLGGSLWILIINSLVFLIVARRFNLFEFNSSPINSKKVFFILASVIVVPIAISLAMVQLVNLEKGVKKEIVALQPSYDSWNEKFERSSGDMLKESIALAEKSLTDSTVLLALPETSLTDFINVDNNPNGDYQLQMLRKLQDKYPNLEILVGANMQKVFDRNISKKPTRAARLYPQSNIWYEMYNSAIYLGKNKEIQFQHKSKLVPGAEQMPFVDVFPFIEKWAVQLDENSTTGTLGVSENPIALGKEKKVGAPICYESNYGEYNGNYVNSGAGIICVITNDGWWGNTDGHKQHMLYGRILAIEHRKWVVRSANTGISCIINPIGGIAEQLGWNAKGAVKGNVYYNAGGTFFSKFGDYIGRASCLVVLIYFILELVVFIKKKLRKN